MEGTASASLHCAFCTPESGLGPHSPCREPYCPSPTAGTPGTAPRGSAGAPRQPEAGGSRGWSGDRGRGVGMGWVDGWMLPRDSSVWLKWGVSSSHVLSAELSPPTQDPGPPWGWRWTVVQLRHRGRHRQRPQPAVQAPCPHAALHRSGARACRKGQEGRGGGAVGHHREPGTQPLCCHGAGQPQAPGSGSRASSSVRILLSSLGFRC